jgi:DNA end-binding protein Ku
MARAIWSGSISFGLVSIPVRLYSAISRKTVRFNQIDSDTGARVKQKRVSAGDGEEVPYERIVKGYELPSGEFVTISEEELAALDPEAERTIGIDEFVDLADIDPIFYDNAYHLVPDAATAKPYKLLATAMEEAGKVAICHFVMRSKQYLAAVRPQDGRLMLSTMVYADEIVDPAEIGGFDILDDIATDERELKMAEQLIATLAADFDPSIHTDTHREAVLDLIERKAAGESLSVVAAPAATSDTVVDLMAALEKSVAAAKVARGRHPSSGGPADGDGDTGSDEDGATGSAEGTESKAPKRAAKRARKSA